MYLAGSCSKDKRKFMEKIADFLRYNDFEVYCPFELKIPDAWSYSQEEWARKVFEKDKEAIDNCEIFLMISEGRTSSAGTNWEQGYAYALGKKVIVFQYTDAETSLMTFAGCNFFISTNKDKIEEDIMLALNDYLYESRCTTTLT